MATTTLTLSARFPWYTVALVHFYALAIKLGFPLTIEGASRRIAKLVRFEVVPG